MKIELTVKKEFDVQFLQVDAGVRYWEDSKVNGVEDENGDLIPCKYGDRWKPLIDVNTGEILNWKQGVIAEIHYKICDDGIYKILDEYRIDIVEIDGYVPSIMCPKGGGYGDYIIMEINEDGIIKNWVCDLDDFQKTED